MVGGRDVWLARPSSVSRSTDLKTQSPLRRRPPVQRYHRPTTPYHEPHQEGRRLCGQSFQAPGICHTSGDASHDEGSSSSDHRRVVQHIGPDDAVATAHAAADLESHLGHVGRKSAACEHTDATATTELQHGYGRGGRGPRDEQPKPMGHGGALATMRQTMMDYGVGPVSWGSSNAVLFNSDFWFVAPVWNAVNCLSLFESTSYFLWSPSSSSEVMCVWFSPSLYRAFENSGELDDREFQVPRHVKKSLSENIQCFLRSSDSFTNLDDSIIEDNNAVKTQELQKAFCHNNSTA